MLRRRVALTALVTAAALLPASTWAGAAPLGVVRQGDDDPEGQKKTVDAQLATTRSDLAITTTALATANTNLEATKAKITAATTALATATATLTRAESTYATAQAAVVTADKEAADAKVRLTAAEAAQTKAEGIVKSTDASTSSARTRVGSIARRAYKTGGFSPASTPAISALGSGDGQTDLTGTSTLLKLNNRAISQLQAQRAQQVATADRLDGVKKQVAAAKAAADAAATRARTARTEAETARKQAEADKTAKTTAKATLDGLQAQQVKDVAALNAKKAGEQTAITTMQAESDRLAGVLKARAEEQRRQAAAEAARKKAAAEAAAKAAADAAANVAPSTPAPAASTSSPVPGPSFVTAPARVGVLDMPAPASTISSGFGYRMHPVLNMWLLHGGQDFAVGCGAPIYASRDGEVIAAGADDSYGNRIIVDHGLVDGNGLATLYAHLTSIVVASGHVTRGQLIGYSGTTGRSTGCHLHFEVRLNGTQVDPMPYF